MTTFRRIGLNPLAKLALLVSFCVLALKARTWPWALALLAAAVLAHAISGVRPLVLWRRVRGIGTFALILFLSQLLLTRDGAMAARAAGGARMTLRFLDIVLASHLFVAATSAEDLAYALMRIGLPYRYGFTLLIAMRFVPYFREQSATILRAQMLRGITVDRPSLRGVWNMARYTLVPLVVTALSRVESLAISMEGRCFGLYPRRTYVRTVPFRALDVAAIAVAVVASAAALALA